MIDLLLVIGFGLMTFAAIGALMLLGEERKKTKRLIVQLKAYENALFVMQGHAVRGKDGKWRNNVTGQFVKPPRFPFGRVNKIT